MLISRQKAIDLLVADAKARKLALASGRDPDTTVEARAVAAAEDKIIREHQHLGKRVGDPGGLPPRLPDAVSAAQGGDLRQPHD